MKLFSKSIYAVFFAIFLSALAPASLAQQESVDLRFSVSRTGAAVFTLSSAQKHEVSHRVLTKNGDVFVDVGDEMITDPTIMNYLKFELQKPAVFKNCLHRREDCQGAEIKPFNQRTPVVAYAYQDSGTLVVNMKAEPWSYFVTPATANTTSKLYIFNVDANNKNNPVKLHFASIDLRTIAGVLADFSKQEIKVDDNVGEVSYRIRVHNIPWDQVIEELAAAANLRVTKTMKGIRISK